MPAIPLFGLGIAAKSPTVTAKLMTNFYAETRPAGEHSMLVAYGTPGLELFCDVEEIARGALEFEKNATAFVVAGDTLWEIDGNGVKTNRGTLLTSSGRVSMAHNGVQIMMVDGFNGYIYNTVTIVFAQITDTDFPAGPQTVCYLARRFVVNFIDSSRFYVSDIDDGLSWDALMFANAEANPDPIIAVWSSTGQLVLLGANTTEFWGNSGTLDFPFVALQGAANEWGMDAVASIAKYDNTFAWLVRNRMGQVMVAQMNGYLPKKISTIDLDHIINTYEATTDSVAYSYMLGGHPMYVISFPSVTPVASAPAASEEDAEAEVAVRAAEDCEPVPPDPIPDRYLYLGAAETSGILSTQSADTKWIWTLANSELFGSNVAVTVTSDVGVQVIATFSTSVLNPDTTGAQPMAICDVPSIGEVWVLVQMWPTYSRLPKILRYSAGTAAVDGSASVAPAFIAAHTFTDTGDPFAVDPTWIGYDPATEKVWIILTQSNLASVYLCIVEPTSLTIDVTINTGVPIGYPQQFLAVPSYVALSGWGGSGVNFMLFNSAAPYATAYTLTLDSSIGGGKPMDYDAVRARFIVPAETGLTYYLVDAVTGSIVTQAFAHAADADTVPAPTTGLLIQGVAYDARLDKYIFAQDGGPATSLTIVNPVTLASESTYTYETGTSLLTRPIFEPQTGGNYVLVFDGTHVKRYYFGTVCPTTPEPPPDPTPTPSPDTGDGGGIGGGPVNQTWLYDGSTGFWSKLKSFGIDRHRVQFSYQCAGQTIGADYANGKQYRITDTALSDNGEAIEGEIIGETLAMPDEAFLTVNKVRVGMETGVGNTLAPGDNPQVSLSIARDSGAKQYGPEMWKPLGKTGEFFTRLEWRRLGTSRYFTAKLRITDNVKRVIVGASINPSD